MAHMRQWNSLQNSVARSLPPPQKKKTPMTARSYLPSSQAHMQVLTHPIDE